MARTKLDVGRTGRELEEAKKKIVIVEREKDELQEDRAMHKAEATELKRQIGYAITIHFYLYYLINYLHYFYI